jgi:hypothetical protein
MVIGPAWQFSMNVRHNSALDCSPAWHMYRKKIFFVSERKENPGINGVNVDGMDERLLVTTTYGDYNMMNVFCWTTFQITPGETGLYSPQIKLLIDRSSQ